MARADFTLVERSAPIPPVARKYTAPYFFMALRTSPDLIPLSHPLNISSVNIDFEPDKVSSCVLVRATVRITDRTGVEMEALTAVAVAGLTMYDMCKSTDRTMTISNIRLMKKSGGKTGTFVRE